MTLVNNRTDVPVTGFGVRPSVWHIFETARGASSLR